MMRMAAQATLTSDKFSRTLTAPAVLLDHLDRIAALKDGWDSYRAKAPTPAAVRCMTTIVGDFAPYLLGAHCKTELGPSLDGGVVLSLDCGDRSLEILIDNAGVVSATRDEEPRFVSQSPTVLKDHFIWLTRPR